MSARPPRRKCRHVASARFTISRLPRHVGRGFDTRLPPAMPLALTYQHDASQPAAGSPYWRRWQVSPPHMPAAALLHTARYYCIEIARLPPALASMMECNAIAIRSQIRMKTGFLLTSMVTRCSDARYTAGPGYTHHLPCQKGCHRTNTGCRRLVVVWRYRLRSKGHSFICSPERRCSSRHH